MAQTIDKPSTDTGFPSPPMPQRLMVRGYRTHHAGTQAVERLVREVGIPRDRITLIARDPTWEDDLDRLGDMQTGARVGALLGALCGLALYLIGVVEDSASALLSVMAAALAGTIGGAAIAAVTRSDRAMTLRIDHYDVLVDDDVAGIAREALRH
jgi:hypothetical protein